MGNDVTHVVLNVPNGGDLVPSLNHMYVVLIPENQSPSEISDFRLISLCNVIYKLITKVIANRLKVYLPNVITKNQSALLPGLTITNNIMIAFKIFYDMNLKRGANGGRTLKLDMSKGFNRVK